MKVFERKKDGSVKIPHTFVILFLILICSVILTWLIPSGAYTRITGANGVKIVQPDQFSYIAKSYVHLWQIPTLVVKGFSSQNVLIFSTLIAGGGFHVLLKTGSIHSLIWIVVKKFGNREAIFIPLLMLICALIATTQSVTIFMAFTPILVMMARAMGFDSLTGAAIPILGGAIGFSTGTLNPSSTIVAQTIAGLPPYSGIGYRFLSLFVFWFFTALFVVHYAKKIKAHPEQSPMYDLDQTSQEMPELNGSQEPLTLRKILCLLTLVVSLSILVYGCIYWKWETQHLSIVFIWMSIIVGCIAGFSPQHNGPLFRRWLQGIFGHGHDHRYCQRHHFRLFQCPCHGHHRPFPFSHHGTDPAGGKRNSHVLGKSPDQYSHHFCQRPGRCCYADFCSFGGHGRDYKANGRPRLPFRRRLLQLYFTLVQCTDGKSGRSKYSL